VSWCIANGASNEGRPAQMELLDTRRRDVGRAAHPDQVALIAGRMLSGAGSMEPRVRDWPPARGMGAARHGGPAGEHRLPDARHGGRFDGVAPPANSEFLADAIPGARLALFDAGPLPAAGPRGDARRHRVPRRRSARLGRPVDCPPWT
jgi:hypothetical protein